MDGVRTWACTLCFLIRKSLVIQSWDVWYWWQESSWTNAKYATKIYVFDEAGNPFLDESPNLITLDTKKIADTKAIETLNNVERIGTEQYHKFVKERLKTKKKRIFYTISTNKFSIFRPPVQRSISKKNEITTLKKSCQQFSQLYIACQVRDGDLYEIFRHENKFSHLFFKRMVSYDQEQSQTSFSVSKE